MKKNLLIAGAVLAAVLMTGCMGGGGKKKAAGEEQEQKATQVKTDYATEEKVAETVTLTANLKGYLEQQIIPAVQERIEKIYVEVGDNVKKGQLLFELSPMQYNQYKIQLDFAKQSRERMQPAFEKGGVSQQQLDELDSNIINLQETVDLFQKNLWFRSPFDGIVTMRSFEEQDLYAPSVSPTTGTMIGVVQVMQMNRLKAYVGVSEQYFTHVKMKMPVEIDTDVYPGQKFEGYVSRIAPSINSATRTFEVEITIPNASQTLRPGMFARTTFNMGESDGVTIFDLAVQRQPGTNDKFVYVVENGTAVRKTVITGRQVGDRVEIVSGLKANEEVVVAGMARLSNGTPVEVVERTSLN